MQWPFRVLIGLGLLIALVGLAQTFGGAKSCAERLENSLESAWSEAWDAVTVATRGGVAGVPTSRSLARSERGMSLLRELESIARDSMGDIELIEPRSSQVQVWLNLFLRLYDETLKTGGIGAAQSLLNLDIVQDDLEHICIELRARNGPVSLSIDVEAECVDGRPSVVRVR